MVGFLVKCCQNCKHFDAVFLFWLYDSLAFCHVHRLANKSDLHEALSEYELSEKMDLEEIVNVNRIPTKVQVSSHFLNDIAIEALHMYDSLCIKDIYLV